MNRNKVLRNRVSLLFVSVISFLGCFSTGTGSGIALELSVQQAFELRMNGNADSAQVMLQQILTGDSSNHAAWYELARTTQHILLGNPRAMMGGLSDLQTTINRAVELDPDNVIYAFYNAQIHHLQAYVALMRDRSAAKEEVGKTVSAYTTVLELDPDYDEVVLYLVELLGIPEEMGGDAAKADKYAAELEKRDAVLGAKAKELRLPEDADRVEFWQGILEQNPGHADVLEQLGKAYLHQDDDENGREYLEKAMAADADKKLLLLDLARYYFMQSRDEDKAATVLPAAGQAIERYLESEPPLILKAYALQGLARVKMGLGAEEEGKRLQAEAEALDRNVSKAFAIPSPILLSKPDQVIRYHSYFFRPL